MKRIQENWKTLGVSTIVAGAMICFTGPALAQSASQPQAAPQSQSEFQTRSASQSNIRQLQQQLKNEGLYSGPVDGINGPMTRSAIRQYQRSHNLAVTGRLDQQTRDQLGLANSDVGETYATHNPSNEGAAGQNSNRNNAGKNPYDEQNKTDQYGNPSNRYGANANQPNPYGANSQAGSIANMPPRSDTNNDQQNAGFADHAQANMPSPSMVKSAQRQLQDKGLYQGSIDGIAGPKTHAAVRQYQQNNGLRITGRLDQSTMSSLGLHQGEVSQK